MGFFDDIKNKAAGLVNKDNASGASSETSEKTASGTIALMDYCHKHIDPSNFKFKNKTAVFVGGMHTIAEYTAKTHVDSSEFILIADVKSIEEIKHLENISKTTIIPFLYYKNNKRQFSFDAKIFVLGNTDVSKEPLNEAIVTYGEKNRIIYAHDTNLKYLLFSYIGTKYKIFNFSQVILETGITGVLVNNSHARRMIIEDCAIAKVQVDVKTLFHPIENTQSIKKTTILGMDKFEDVIGTFGEPSIDKGTDVIYKTVKQMNQDGRKTALIMAGRNATNFCNRMNFDGKFLFKYDAPTDLVLFSLMKSVDLAIQMQMNGYEKSSNTLHQLLGMGQNIIATQDMLEKPLENLIYTAPSYIDVVDFVKLIKIALATRKEYDNKALVEKYSYKNLENEIKKAVQCVKSGIPLATDNEVVEPASVSPVVAPKAEGEFDLGI